MDKASVVAALRRAAECYEAMIADWGFSDPPSQDDYDTAPLLRTLADRIEQGTERQGTVTDEKWIDILVIDWTPIGDRKP